MHSSQSLRSIRCMRNKVTRRIALLDYIIENCICKDVEPIVDTTDTPIEVVDPVFVNTVVKVAFLWRDGTENTFINDNIDAYVLSQGTQQITLKRIPSNFLPPPDEFGNEQPSFYELENVSAGETITVNIINNFQGRTNQSLLNGNTFVTSDEGYVVESETI